MQLQEISDTASKQFAIEQSLGVMKQQWVGVEFALKEHRDTKSFILMGNAVEEIQVRSACFPYRYNLNCLMLMVCVCCCFPPRCNWTTTS